MAVPRRRHSKTRQRKRRAQHDFLIFPGEAVCSRCGEPKLPHRVCLNCGFYKTKQVINPKVTGEAEEI